MSGRRWTEEELELLEQLSGTYTVATIAKRLGRSFDAVNIKLNRMGLSGFEKSTCLITANQVCQMFGIDGRTLRGRWKNNGLKLLRKGNYVCVRQDDLIKFLKNNPDQWNAKSVKDDSIVMCYPWYKEKRRNDEKKQYFWTSTDLSTLNILRHQGYSIREIAEKMGRSESSIKYKLYGRRK